MTAVDTLETPDVGFDSADHIAALAASLVAEVQAAAAHDPRHQTAATALRRRLADIESAGFARAVSMYRQMVEAKCAAFNAVSEVAASYVSMEEFWADVPAQEAGESPRGYWDSYEHGRRRQLEQVAATAYGSESAVLVNTGMSAIEIALSAALRAGSVVLTHTRSYFETSDLVEGVLPTRGIEVVRADLSDPTVFRNAIDTVTPDVILFETALNCPPCSLPAIEVLDPSDPPLIVDNSTLGHGIGWFDLLPDHDMVVVESGIKFLTGTACAGVLYGNGSRIEQVREYARRVGQQLQERAFNAMQVGELERSRERLALHSRNARRFREAMSPDHWEWIEYAGSASSASNPLADVLDADGSGPLIFARLRGPDDTIAERHRALLVAWKAQAQRAGVDVVIRAGFGWMQTSARCYESSFLNQADAPIYMRFSIGAEPLEAIDALSRALDAAIAEVATCV